MFLEPHSQIVAKELVVGVEMDLAMEKLRLIGEVNMVTQGNCISENGRGGE